MAQCPAPSWAQRKAAGHLSESIHNRSISDRPHHSSGLYICYSFNVFSQLSLLFFFFVYLSSFSKLASTNFLTLLFFSSVFCIYFCIFSCSFSACYFFWHVSYTCSHLSHISLTMYFYHSTLSSSSNLLYFSFLFSPRLGEFRSSSFSFSGFLLLL